MWGLSVPEDVDEDLQEDVEQECNKYGKVDHIVIYQVRIPLLFTNLTQLSPGEAR